MYIVWSELHGDWYRVVDSINRQLGHLVSGAPNPPLGQRVAYHSESLPKQGSPRVYHLHRGTRSGNLVSQFLPP